VSASSGVNGSITPTGNQVVQFGTVLAYTLSPNTNYAGSVNSTCGGSLSGNTFTTNPITANCSVQAVFTQVVFAVQPNVGANGTITPNSTQMVNINTTRSFTVTPNANYTATVSGTCGGALVGTTYTTAPITANCSFTVLFNPMMFMVTPGAIGGGTITPSMPVQVAFGNTAVFGVVPDAGYQVSMLGSCGGGLSGLSYVTAAIVSPCSVTAVFTLIPVLPGAPLLQAAVPGDARATLSFALASANGSPISRYDATCSDGAASITASASTSPITLTGLTNGTTYTCNVTATNGIGTGPASMNQTVTPSTSAPLVLVHAASRKTHAAAGVFDVPLNIGATLNAAPSVEPRQAKPGHRIVFLFNDVVLDAGSATAVDINNQPVGIATPSRDDNTVVVDLSGIAEGSAVRVMLNNATSASGALNAAVSVAFLVGDVGGTRRVSAADIAAVKAMSGQAVTAHSARFDLDQNGSIGVADINIAKGRAARTIP
jgi:hypothetical protein